MNQEFPILKEIREKDRAYRQWVASLPSVISGRTPCDPHHLKGHGQSGEALKTTDYYCFPLTHEEHMELHERGWRRWEADHDSQWRFVAETMLRAKREGVFQ